MKIKSVNWKARFISRGVDAEDAHGELERIKKKANGNLVVDDIVDAAQPENNVLNPIIYYCSDQQAALEHRRDVARLLIRSIEVVYEEAPATPVRLYHVKHQEQASGGERTRTVYTDLAEMLSDPELHDVLVERAKQELVSFRRKYNSFTQLSGVFAAIEEFLSDEDCEVAKETVPV